MEGDRINPMPASAPPAAPRLTAPVRVEVPAARADRASVRRGDDHVELNDLAHAGQRLLNPQSAERDRSIEEIFALAEKVRDASVAYLREVVQPPPPDGRFPDRPERTEDVVTKPKVLHDEPAARKTDAPDPGASTPPASPKARDDSPAIVEQKPRPFSGGRGAIDLVA